jgi:uncharacterized protein (TIGR01777 family)
MNILITGGTGLVGKPLAKLLKSKGHRLFLLSRTNKAVDNYDVVMKWDVAQQTINWNTSEKIDVLIHLAGAGIADERWTESRKKLILDSRVKSAELLKKQFEILGYEPSIVVGASAIGYYGSVTHEKAMTENDSAYPDFLGKTCENWEIATESIAPNARLVKIRIGIVLAKEGGALPKMAQAARNYAGAPLGSGNQHLPWIHINDLCQLFEYAISNNALSGAYNANAVTHCTNRDFTKTLCKTLNKPMLPLPVPTFVLKLLFGEMATVVLNGCPVSNQKIKNSGYQFQFTDLNLALKNLF